LLDDVVVTRLEQYGAWIECGGKPGLVTIPEVSWSRIGHPADVLAVGQHLPVKILNVRDDGQFTASVRAVHPEQDPWYNPAVFAVGSEFVGPVVRVLDYGCFVELRPEVWGLLRRKNWPGPVAAGDQLRVRVESVDAAARKVEVVLVSGSVG
jgi:ribosomal protein S1